MIGALWSQIIMSEGIRVQAPSIDLDTKQFLDPDIAQVDFRTEMVQQRKLAGLVRRFENRFFHPESLDKPFGEFRLKPALFIKKPDILRAFSSFHHDSQRARIQPLSSPVHQLLNHI